MTFDDAWEPAEDGGPDGAAGDLPRSGGPLPADAGDVAGFAPAGLAAEDYLALARAPRMAGSIQPSGWSDLVARPDDPQARLDDLVVRPGDPRARSVPIAVARSGGAGALGRLADQMGEAERRRADVERGVATALAPGLGAPAGRGAQPPGGGSTIPLRGPQSLDPPPGVRLGPLGSGADIEVKPEARLGGLAPDITRTYPNIVDAWRAENAPRPVITSGNDGTHMHGSRHYSDQAIDLRGNNVDARTAQALRDRLRNGLGPDYDVLYETFPDRRRNHIHVEYDPHTGRPRT